MELARLPPPCLSHTDSCSWRSSGCGSGRWSGCGVPLRCGLRVLERRPDRARGGLACPPGGPAGCTGRARGRPPARCAASSGRRRRSS